MTPDELASRYRVRFRMGNKFADLRHTIAGVPVETSFQFQNGGLSSIAVAVLRRYEAWGDGDQDVRAIVGWISERAGTYTERDAASVRWLLPTAKIWTYCDESLGVYFDQPKGE